MTKAIPRLDHEKGSALEKCPKIQAQSHWCDAKK